MNIPIPEECPKPDEIVDIVNKFRKKNTLPEVKVLGQGSYGKVIRYKDWVIKIVEIPSPHYRHLFDSETIILKELSNIRDLYDFIPRYCWSGISDKGTMGIIVQMYESVVTLHDIIHAPGLLPAEAAYEFMRNLIEGFEILHAAGYVHRDIKPANILVRKGGPNKYIPIIIDFGFACPKPCQDFERKGTPGYVPLNWMANTEGKGHSRGFQRENMYLIHHPDESVTKENAKTGIVRPHKSYRLSFEESIPPNIKTRKKIKTQPRRLTPHYTDYSDNYSLFLTLYQIFAKVDWKGHEDERDEMIEHLQKLRNQEVFELAAQAAREESPEAKARRTEALKRLNSRRNARMENRARENEEAKLLANFAETNRTRKRARRNNSNHLRPQTRQRLEDARRG